MSTTTGGAAGSGQTAGNAVVAPNLPVGGGAIRGIDESFTANPATGSASFSITLPISAGRSGFTPDLSLSYDSGSGNGPFGLGWSLSLQTIARRLDRHLPLYDDATPDVFVLSGQDDLVPVLEPDNTGAWQHTTVARDEYDIDLYRPRVEGFFGRVERWVRRADGDTYWRAITVDNVTTVFGRTPESRIADPVDPSRVFSWLACACYDALGNAMVYEYLAEDSANVGTAPDGSHDSTAHEGRRTDATRAANRYLARVRYGNRVPNRDEQGAPTDPALVTDWMFSLVLDYGDHDVRTAPDVDEQQFVSVTDARSLPDSWPARQDPFSTYRPGFEVRTYRLCRRLLMFHHFPDELGRDDYLARSLLLTYDENPTASFLTRVTEFGHVLRPTASDADRYLTRALPPVDFGYREVPDAATLAAQPLEAVTGPGAASAVAAMLDPDTIWVDLDGEGSTGLLSETDGGLFYLRNTSAVGRVARFTSPTLLADRPGRALAGDRGRFVDLDGDGVADLVYLSGNTPGYHGRTENGWADFRTFESSPTVDVDDRRLRWIDLDGDGLSDLLLTDDDVFTWYPSRGVAGFGPAVRRVQAVDENNGPRAVFGDDVQTIFIADISGDGLSDLVRIRNGDVCYWPNLGHGRFGAKVTMDHAPVLDPPDRFDPARIRLADLDGSGTADLVYAGAGGVVVHRNQSGNAWSDAVAVPQLPHVERPEDVQVVDLLGTGTACVVASSRRPDLGEQAVRYVDLMAGQKPHLLTRTTNGLGVETTLEYAPSTTFAVADAAAGRPWVTTLPFPVHVVERVVTRDLVSDNVFVTRYAYHHGYFDGTEREFRGFAMVERFDTENFAALASDGQLTGANIDAATQVPPTVTRTWFHTGVFVGGEHVSNYFAGLGDATDRGEYYREPGTRDDDAAAAALLLPDTVLPAGMTAGEARQACRALKTAVLREEIYALDPSANAEDPLGTPYVVTENNYGIVRLQPAAGDVPGVFFRHRRETLTTVYDRTPNDPRVRHNLVVDVDPATGLARKEAAIAYGRRATVRVVAADGSVSTIANPGLEALDPVDRAVQTRVQITWTEHRYATPVSEPDDHRVDMLAESTMWELSGFRPADGASRFSFSELTDDDFAAFTDAEVIAAEDTADPTTRQRRVVQQSRTLYRAEELTGLAPLGEAGPRALPGPTYRLALTPGLVAAVFVRADPAQPAEQLLPDPESVLEGRAEDAGGYVAMDGAWWIPSGQVFYDPAADPDDPATTAAQELATARDHFFVPRVSVDPFGRRTVVDHDRDHLFVVRSVDALGNTVLVDHDYRVLEPVEVTDANRNRTVVAHDALGMVVARALEGKDNDAIGDRLDDIEPDPTPAVVRALLTDPLTQAAALLGPATQRFVYDVDRFARGGQPAVSVTLSRELHLHQENGTPSPVRVRLSFSDGFGREVQVKSEAQPGPAPQREPPTSSPAGDVIPGALVRDANANPTFAPTTPRWVGTGRVVLNNKGKPVRRFDPFFSSTHLFETEPEVTEIGVSAVLFYDPVERVIATIRPDHVYEKVAFSPWRQATYDANDTVAPRGDQTGDPRTDPDIGDVVAGYFAAQDPGWSTWYQQRIGGQLGAAEQRAAVQAEVHADTPAFAHLDALGRPFATIGENRFVLDGNVVEQQHRTTVVWDIRGNQHSVLDGDDRVVMVYEYDLDGHRLHQSSVDSGEVWVLDDAAGRTIRSWDGRRLDRRLTYDALRRPTGVRLTDHGVEREAERIVYGEPAGDSDNLRLQIQQVFDSAGTLTQASYDFKGNAVDTRRNLLADYTLDVDWALDPPLDDAGFRVQRSFDALDRPRTVVSPDASVYQPSFDEGGLLETVTVRLRGATEPTPFVTAVDYDARGQRVRVAFGNGAESASSYDPLTRRLAALRTTRPTGPDATASQLFADPTVVQDLRYTYDPSGNITRIEDAALPTIVPAGQVVEPVRTYTYDAAYRVIEATGREHIGQTQLDLAAAGSRRDFPFAGAHPNDLQALRNCTERYEYDDVGNLTQLRHLVDGNGWNRQYEYADSPLQPDHSSNRLTRTTVANGTAVAEDYRYTDAAGTDVAGCITAINAMGFAWDHKRRLARADLGGGGTAHIRYDVADQRVRKVVESSAGVRRTERIWFEGFEISREYGAPGDHIVSERETLHVFAHDDRVALVETQTIDGGAPVAGPPTLARYQVADHLDSATVELDGTGALIALEEYHPYGTTSFQAGRNATEVNLRHYRFTGKERDEETGLSYYGARYYAPWLGRWCSPDPLGIGDGTNVYVYARNNPLVYVDTAGTDVKKVVRTDNFHELLRQAISEVEKKTISKEAADKQYAKYAKSTALGSAISAATDPIGKKFQEKVQLLGRVTTKLEGFSPPGWEEAHGNPEACFKLACAGVDQTNPPGETSTGGGGVILYRAEKQRIKTEPTASQVALEQIRRHVDAGRAVVAGVNEPANPHVVDPIKQPVTDHFVAVYGYETDSTGRITALFAKDNAVGGTAEVKFDVAANGAIGKPEEPKRPSVLAEEYQLSEVRFHTGFEYTGDLRPLTDLKELMFWPKPPDPPDPKKKK